MLAFESQDGEGEPELFARLAEWLDDHPSWTLKDVKSEVDFDVPDEETWYLEVVVSRSREGCTIDKPCRGCRKLDALGFTRCT